jgi:uncharacterized repeat protein (TIGR03803 family)
MSFSLAKRSTCATLRHPSLTTFILAAALATAGFAQTPVTIYEFLSNGVDVVDPTAYGTTVQARDGNLYSASDVAGANGAGGVYVVTPSGAESVLYSFPHTYSGCKEGLTLGNDGNLYGVCSSHGQFDYGLLYKITPEGVFTDLHDFSNTGSDGAQPGSPPIQATDRNYYGTTYAGGVNGNGTIYKLTPDGTVTTLYSFKNTTDGVNPDASLVQGKDGNLYGSTVAHGANFYGVIFKITTKGKLTPLHSFNLTDGSGPVAPLIQGTDGNFYGTTYQGGTNDQGVAFKITPSGKYTMLHSFTASTDGLNPETAMVQATDGNFYGTTNSYDDNRDSLYKITPKGVFSIVYQFSGSDNSLGIGLANGPVQHTNGLLYGATNTGPTVNNESGTIYTIDIGAQPFARLSTTSGIVGTSVSIFGQGFGSSSAVSFGGVDAPGPIVDGSTYITVQVPAGALTGSVKVTTGSNTLTCNQIFAVTPQLKTFSPPQGPVGTPVVITGVSLTQASKVKFGSVAASFTVNSDTQITAIVPAGATTGKIGITTKGGTATSKSKFTVQ